MVDYTERPWLRLYPDRIAPQLEQHHETMLDVWDTTASRFGHRPWIHYFEDTLTMNDVDAAADAFATALVEGGLRPVDRVALYLQNDPQWPILLLAIWKAGGIAVALNPMFRQRELSYHLDDSGASVLVCLESLYRTVAHDVVGSSAVQRVITTHSTDLVDADDLPAAARDQMGPKNSPVGTDDLPALLERYRGRRPDRPSLTGDDVAILTYTSGTTGPPKGAMNTHGNMAYNSQLASEWFDLSERDVVLGVAPLFHITGILAHMGVSMYSGAPLVLFHRFDPGTCLHMIERWGVTYTVGAITAFIALMDHPDMAQRNVSSLEKVASGGAPVSPTIVDRFDKISGVYVHNVYGLTETTSPSHLTPLGIRPPVDSTSGALAVGIPVPGCNSSVVDPETREPVAVGEVGEIVIAGPMVVPGYWEKDEETGHAMPGGHLHTGDIGFMDDDGWFFIVDRSKDQINAGGYKIWPREVEDVLYQHPAVREAAVVGKPDPYRGETVKAYVSLRESGQASADELVEFCQERMAAYKYPREVEILDELPKTLTGKLLRRELRAREIRSQSGNGSDS